MAKLTVCIPVEANAPAPGYLVSHLLADPNASIEVLIGCIDASTADRLAQELGQPSFGDSRLSFVTSGDANISLADLWSATVRAASGDWITLVSCDDMLEPELPQLLQFLETQIPGADALAWNAFQIDPDAPRDVPANVAVPVLHNLAEIDKPAMLQAFFQWDGAQRTPRMPFGLYHGAIRRSLAETILNASGPLSWLTLAPQYEWSARVLLFASTLALSNRPLSAVNAKPFSVRDVPSALQGFPFDARLGITAAIAEIQARVLHELGGEWSGFNEHFVRACLYDCVMEHDQTRFVQKCRLYQAALMRMPGGAELAAGFRPQYMPHLPPDRLRGKRDMLLLVDRFIGNARTAQQFYAVVREIMTPVSVFTNLKPDNDATSSARRTPAATRKRRLGRG